MQDLADKKKRWPPKEVVRQAYVVERLTWREMKSRFNLGAPSIQRMIKKYGLWREEIVYHDRRFYASSIVALYQTGVSSWDIARRYQCSNQHILNIIRASGCKVNEPGAKKTKTCKIAGCDRPVKNKLHKQNGCLYGTRCEEHERQYHREWRRNRYRQTVGVSPENLCCVEGQKRCSVDGCTRLISISPTGRQRGRVCDYHKRVRAAKYSRDRYRRVNGTTPDKWRVMDGSKQSGSCEGIISHDRSDVM